MLIVLILAFAILNMLLLGPDIAIFSFLLRNSFIHICISQALVSILRTRRTERFLSIASGGIDHGQTRSGRTQPGIH